MLENSPRGHDFAHPLKFNLRPLQVFLVNLGGCAKLWPLGEFLSLYGNTNRQTYREKIAIHCYSIRFCKLYKWRPPQITKGGYRGGYTPLNFFPYVVHPPLKKSGLCSAPHPLASKTLVTCELYCDLQTLLACRLVSLTLIYIVLLWSINFETSRILIYKYNICCKVIYNNLLGISRHRSQYVIRWTLIYTYLIPACGLKICNLKIVDWKLANEISPKIHVG